MEFALRFRLFPDCGSDNATLCRQTSSKNSDWFGEGELANVFPDVDLRHTLLRPLRSSDHFGEHGAPVYAWTREAIFDPKPPVGDGCEPTANPSRNFSSGRPGDSGAAEAVTSDTARTQFMNFYRPIEW